MGRKGVSKRKPKQQKSSNANTSGNASTRSGGNAVASLVKDTGAPLHRSSTNPSAGSNKNRNKGN